jgi:uncharacterized lipoprotein YehR (DUF1307 family)
MKDKFASMLAFLVVLAMISSTALAGCGTKEAPSTPEAKATEPKPA